MRNRRKLFLPLALLALKAGRAETVETITRGKYTVVFVNKDSGFSPVTKQRLIDTYFNVYPLEAQRFNPRVPHTVRFVIDANYHGVAATDAGVVTFNPAWFAKHP